MYLPAAGEIVVFDRSWYNRGRGRIRNGVCTKEQHRGFLDLCPIVEKYIVEGGSFSLSIGLEDRKKEQQRRFETRINVLFDSGSSAQWI